MQEKRSNVSIHCVLKCHNHQRRKKIIIFTTYSTQSVRDSRRPAIYHLIPRPPPWSKLTGVRHAGATLPVYAAVAPPPPSEIVYNYCPVVSHCKKKPYLYRRCFPHSPEIILHFIPMRVHNRVLSKNHHQAF